MAGRTGHSHSAFPHACCHTGPHCPVTPVWLPTPSTRFRAGGLAPRVFTAKHFALMPASLRLTALSMRRFLSHGSSSGTHRSCKWPAEVLPVRGADGEFAVAPGLPASVLALSDASARPFGLLSSRRWFGEVRAGVFDVVYERNILSECRCGSECAHQQE